MAFSTSASAAKKKEEKGTATSGVDGVLVQDSREANICRMLKTWIDVKDESGFRGHFVSGQKGDDLDALVNHFTAPALARALRDREETLAHCAQLVATGSMQELKSVLEPFGGIKPDRKQRIRKLIMPDLNEPGGLFQESVLERLKVRLNRLPREITKRARLRACVVLPMCLVKNEPSILFTKRSDDLRRHKGEVCFPGGMVDDVDYSIVDAGLRELHEEIGIEPKNVDVLGILRCDWGEVHSLTGVAVTPVCGYLGSIDRTEFKLNPSEVENCFTVPVVDLLDKSNWSMQRFNAPVFRVPGDTDEKKVVWGLTGYILHRFTKLLPSIVFEKDGVNRSFSFAN
eukprot:CAMPEP_0184012690 /NCGR_PEP_ID=MMETSP0954-20121128/4579_1 /TAXON_ID=627963 /ORGANISM="Aplanochytrium sp, Strain PBS07" /LENGTH=342 /DNA_ID=CAMNT_0026292759 /DNA_START=404 /DNA_END=1432 /DNA_ORIENTATION=+